MTSALFGPDGTQPPEPEAVLPDALVGPGSLGPMGRSAESWGGLSTAPLSGLPLPAIDQAYMQRAIADAQTPPGGLPAQRYQPQRPPQGRQPQPQRQRQPQPQRPTQPSRQTLPQRPIQAAPPGANPYANLPPPPTGYRAAPQNQLQRPQLQGQPQRRPQEQRQRQRQREQENPLLRARKVKTPNSLIGCIVMLIFVVAIAFQPIAALVKTLLELVR